MPKTEAFIRFCQSIKSKNIPIKDFFNQISLFLKRIKQGPTQRDSTRPSVIVPPRGLTQRDSEHHEHLQKIDYVIPSSIIKPGSKRVEENEVQDDIPLKKRNTQNLPPR